MEDFVLYFKDESVREDVLEKSLHAFEAEAYNFGHRFINDSNVRVEYFRRIKETSDEFLKKVNSGELTPQQAANEVHKLRDEIMEISRLKSSDIGKAVAEKVKAKSPLLEALGEKYAKDKFSKRFVDLTKQQQDEVYREIVKSGGRANPKWTSRAKNLGRAGRGLVVLTLTIAVYNVATADDKLQAAGKEGVVIGGGFLGGAAGGALAGLACGPGAPVCVTIGVFIGGIVGSLGAEYAFHDLFGAK